MSTRTIEWHGGDRFRKVLNEMAGKLAAGGVVQVGFFEESRYTPSHPIRGTKRRPLPVAQVAFWNEFGTSRTPARPFFRTAIKGNSGYWGKDLAEIAKATGYDTRKTLTRMGESIKDDIVHSITVWSQPPNSAKWAKIKGFNKPLIDDGTMQREVGFKVKGV